MKKNELSQPNDFKPNTNVFGLPNGTYRFWTFTVIIIYKFEERSSDHYYNLFQTFFRLATCFLMTHEIEKSIFVTLVGIDRFGPTDDIDFLRQLLKYISQRYRPALLKVRGYIAEQDDFEVGCKDIFIFMESLPEADDSEYLMSVEDFAKEGHTFVLKMDGEGKSKNIEFAKKK